MLARTVDSLSISGLISDFYGVIFSYSPVSIVTMLLPYIGVLMHIFLSRDTVHGRFSAGPDPSESEIPTDHGRLSTVRDPSAYRL